MYKTSEEPSSNRDTMPIPLCPSVTSPPMQSYETFDRPESSSSRIVFQAGNIHRIDGQQDSTIVEVNTLGYTANNESEENKSLAMKLSSLTGKESFMKWLLAGVGGRSLPIKPFLFSVGWSAIAVGITFWTSKNHTALNGKTCRWWCTPLHIDGSGLAYVGFALFLLTNFRVAEAYGRYMEGLRLWTKISGTIRITAVNVMQSFPSGMLHEGDRERLLGFLAAFPFALKGQLREDRNLDELRDVLSQEDISRLQNEASMPAYCVYVITGYFLAAKKFEPQLPEAYITKLVEWAQTLGGIAESCKQIKTMPAPYSYIGHMNIFLTLWLFLLPFSLVESSGWITIVIVAIASYGIIGIVTNAAELEDPFGTDYNDLPLERFAKEIQGNIARVYEGYFVHNGTMIRKVDESELRSRPSYWLRSHK